jgi:hypothetical protein
MVHNDEENRYKQAVDVLKQLPKVNAPLNFETDLMRRINSGRFEDTIKESFWDILLSPARLLPSAALAVLAAVLFFVVDTSSVEQADPLTLEPRIREDVTLSKSTADISIDTELKALTEQSVNRQENDASGTRFSTAANITKAGLNFRQITLTDEEKRVLINLKAKIRQYMQQTRNEEN